MEHSPQGNGEYDAYVQRVVGLIGDDLFVRDEWGEYYDPDDFRGRDQLAMEADMLADALQSHDNALAHARQQQDAERIGRFATALNRIQAYTMLAEASPDHSLLRRHQIPFMRDICDFLEFDIAERRGGHAVIPTGVGKTVLFNEVIFATGLRTLVVADTNEQVRQNRDKLLGHAEGRAIDAGIVDGTQKIVGKDVTYTTYASLLNQMRKPDGARIICPDDYDMIIFDEAHLVLGENRRTVIKHFDHAIKMAFTATDKYTEEKQVAILLPHEITRMSLVEAEDKKLVAPHHNIIVETEADMRHVPVASTGDFAQDVLFESINTDARNLVAVETYLKLFYGKKTIDFCGGIQHAKDLAKMYREHDIPAEAVWGDMDEKERRRVFRQFREGELLHITNADLVTTGFDMKSVECAFMLQPSLSLLRTMQIGGRANRLWELLPDKVAYIVQFLDIGYRQLPYLFAETDAAGSAQHGWDGFVFPVLDTSGLPFNVLHDPIDVDWLASQHHEARGKRNLPPPSGWASFDELRILSKRPASHIKKAYDAFRAEQEKAHERMLTEGIEPDHELLDLEMHSGIFMNPETDGGRKRYVSPELVERMAQHLEQYKVKESTYWRRPVEVQEIYGRSVSWVTNSLLWRVRGRPDMAEYEAKLVEEPDSTKKLSYYHYELYKAGAILNELAIDVDDLIRPPADMRSEHNVREEMDEEFCPGAYDIALSRSNRTPMGWGNQAGSIAYEVDGELTQYYTNAAIRRLVDQLIPDSNRAPLADLLTRGELGRLGLTEDDIIEELTALLDKKPELSWQAGLYYDVDAKRMRYYARREIHAHLYERLVRKHQSKLSGKRVEEVLQESPVLRRDFIPLPETPAATGTTPEELSDEERAFVNESIDAIMRGETDLDTVLKQAAELDHRDKERRAEKSAPPRKPQRVDADASLEKLARAKKLIERYRRLGR